MIPILAHPLMDGWIGSPNLSVVLATGMLSLRSAAGRRFGGGLG